MNEPVPSDLFIFEDEQLVEPSLKVNGEQTSLEVVNGYASIQGSWKKGDVILLNLAMEDRIISANENVEAKSGLKAVQYGPLVYCAEEIDNSTDVLDAQVSKNSRFSASFRPELRGGVNMLEGEDLNLVPYFAWANRGTGKMNVWFDKTSENQ